MWELRSKNIYGEVEQITKSNSFTDKPVYDDIKPNAGCNTANLRVQYEVDWLPERNYHAFEQAQKVGSSVEPWELFNEYMTDSLGLAIRQIMLRTLDERCDNEQFRMYIETPEGKYAEVIADIPTDIRPIMRNMVEAGINKRIDSLTETINSLTNELKSYRDFIAKYNADELFREFKSGQKGE